MNELDQLRIEINELRERVAKLEAAPDHQRGMPPMPAPMYGPFPDYVKHASGTFVPEQNIPPGTATCINPVRA